MIKRFLLLTLVVAGLMATSCMKRIEGILREQPTEVSREEAVKLMNYYNEQLSTAETLLNENNVKDLRTFLKSPEWAKAEGCRSMLSQLPPEMATEMNIAEMEIHFVDFVNKVIDKGIPLRELPEE